MLELQMEEAISNCPDLFIEPGLTLVRRQVVINGRRPDILFSDVLSRHLLVEIQRGRLDEDHLQRHFYYYFDYRAKYPSTHLRLMFIANRLVPQHKEFLDEHGYEFREVAEGEFERRVSECRSRQHGRAEKLEIVTTPGVLPPETCELLYKIEMQPMTMCYKMLLLMAMAEVTDADGRAPLAMLSQRFRDFFVSRAAQGKAEENPNRVRSSLSSRTVSAWGTLIREQPVHHLTEEFVIDEGIAIRWAPGVWSRWDDNLKKEIVAACRDRLIRYFERHVPGGY
jgi:hypothetical protein